MRTFMIATFATLGLIGSALAQGATGAGTAPAIAGKDAGKSTPTTGTGANTAGAAGSGTSQSDKNGAGADLPNAVQKQAPNAPK